MSKANMPKADVVHVLHSCWVVKPYDIPSLFTYNSSSNLHLMLPIRHISILSHLQPGSSDPSPILVNGRGADLCLYTQAVLPCYRILAACTVAGVTFEIFTAQHN